MRRAAFALLGLLGLAACNPNQTVGQNVDRDANATGNTLSRAANSTGNALGRATDATGNAVSNAADSTGRTLNNAGTATRDTLDPPRGPAEQAGRAADRATGSSY